MSERYAFIDAKCAHGRPYVIELEWPRWTSTADGLGLRLACSSPSRKCPDRRYTACISLRRVKTHIGRRYVSRMNGATAPDPGNTALSGSGLTAGFIQSGQVVSTRPADCRS